MAVEAYYWVAKSRLGRCLSPTATTAVTIHLYHLDSWDLFAARLASLERLPFDLFVTIPVGSGSFADTIRQRFPQAHIMAVPNHGRGTLPFLKIAQLLTKRGYQVVLKLHSTRPPTVGTGRSLQKIVIERLLPSSPELIDHMIERLSCPTAALVGPAEVYLPLQGHIAGTKDRLAAVIAALLGRAKAREVMDNPAGYGFFAGSMFWARLDALAPFLRFRAFRFEPEAGQTDGTMPHILERAFTLVPHLQGRTLLESSNGTLQPRRPDSCNVPWWL
jgi:lipopolysaccharide biosynthesis protein